MKKLFFMTFCFVAVSLMSCGNQTTGSSAVSDSDSVVVDTLDTVAVDSAAVDSTVCPD